MLPDPLGVPRNPFHVFLLVICLLNGGVLASGVSTSLSLEAGLVPLFERLYGLILFIGAGAVLAGMFWPADPRSGLLLKRAGYLALGISATIFGIVGVVRFGLVGLLSASVAIAFGAICFWYVWRVERFVRASLRRDHDGS